MDIIILAAGQGTRMKSRLPKVLHDLGGRPLLQHVLETALGISNAKLHVVIGHGAGQVRETFADWSVNWVEQSEQLGTGHAVQQVQPHLGGGDVLILYGDVPLIRRATLDSLLALVTDQHMALLTAELNDPTGYGRVVRGPDHHVQKIVEHKDANDNIRKITEINTGIMAVRGNHLSQWLDRLSNDNAQKEYYLTDIIAMAVQDGIVVEGVPVMDTDEILGINDRVQLADMERRYQRQQAEQLMRAGATLMDPARIDIRGEVTIEGDVTIDVNVVLEGQVKLARGCCIEAHCVLRDCTLAESVHVKSFSHIEQAHIGAGAIIGPFARLRPGTELAGQVHVGNFVELKNTKVDQGSKINHLSYIGDTVMGKGVNIGAGTITCNYDGANKHQTVIEDDVFIGSDTQLVAPVKVGKGATIGAGSTITKDAPNGELTLSRAKQITREGWQRPRKK